MFSTILENPMMWSLGELTYLLPGQGLKGIKFTWDGISLNSSASALASWKLSLTSFNMTYLIASISICLVYSHCVFCVFCPLTRMLSFGYLGYIPPSPLHSPCMLLKVRLVEMF